VLYTILPTHAAGIFACGYYTGMRPHEAVNLRWPQINLKRREITLAASDTKDDEARVVPIPESFITILVSIPRNLHCDNIFRYKSLPVRSIRAALRKACEKTEIPYGRKTENGLTVHDLRHTFVTNMRRAGVDETVIMKIIGHSTREMFDRYNYVSDEEAASAMMDLERYLGK